MCHVREIGPTTLEKLGSYANMRQISMFAASFELGLEQHLTGRGLVSVQRFTRWLVETGGSCRARRNVCGVAIYGARD